MQYMECDVPQGEGYCLDNDCPCPPTRLSRGQGYLFISPEVVAFRKDCLSRSELQQKLAPSVERGEYVSVTAYEPVIVCEEAAHSRNLDLRTAAEDAKRWWNEGIAPLRPTPKAAGGFMPASFEAAEPSKPAIPPETPGASFVDDNGPDADSAAGTGQNEFSGRDYGDSNLADNSQASDGVSANDVAEQYANSPLAELAEKMAQAEQGGDSPAVSSASETVTGPKTTLGWPDRAPDAPPIAGVEETPARRAKKKRPVSWVVVAVLSGLVVAAGGVLALLLVSGYSFEFGGTAAPMTAVQTEEVPVDEYRPDQSQAEFAESQPEPAALPATKPEQDQPAQKLAETSPEPEPESRRTATENMGAENPGPAGEKLAAAFFTHEYSFRDKKYSGEIRFTSTGNGRGTYEQKVKLPGKDKLYTVTGAFSFTPERITYQPEGAQTEVIWSLEKWSSEQGKAVFYDPRQNRDESRVFLTAKN